ncbi:MAG: class I SAM-dependent methyltransferase [Actinomycetota bacterium]|nr:class I SAM-dependent methyltransferase [Actinomycetota bacterium]
MTESPGARWRDALGEWAIPATIIEAAPESPWSHPPELFRWQPEEDRARQIRPSRQRALEVLPDGGSVIDVGVGGGASSLGLVPRAGRIIGVDESETMLLAFAESARAAGVASETVHGRWPDVAGEVGPADVVVCHHVFYNVGDLEPFASALTDHARHRVVVELSQFHPQSPLNPLWKALHDIDRPTRPTADDAMAVLSAMGLEVQREEVEVAARWREVTPEVVAFGRRRLCLAPDRDAEVAMLLEEHGGRPQRVVTLWWPGTAGGAYPEGV